MTIETIPITIWIDRYLTENKHYPTTPKMLVELFKKQAIPFWDSVPSPLIARLYLKLSCEHSPDQCLDLITHSLFKEATIEKIVQIVDGIIQIDSLSLDSFLKQIPLAQRLSVIKNLQHHPQAALIASYLEKWIEEMGSGVYQKGDHYVTLATRIATATQECTILRRSVLAALHHQVPRTNPHDIIPHVFEMKLLSFSAFINEIQIEDPSPFKFLNPLPFPERTEAMISLWDLTNKEGHDKLKSYLFIHLKDVLSSQAIQDDLTFPTALLKHFQQNDSLFSFTLLSLYYHIEGLLKEVHSFEHPLINYIFKHLDELLSLNSVEAIGYTKKIFDIFKVLLGFNIQEYLNYEQNNYYDLYCRLDQLSTIIQQVYNLERSVQHPQIKEALCALRHHWFQEIVPFILDVEIPNVNQSDLIAIFLRLNVVNIQNDGSLIELHFNDDLVDPFWSDIEKERLMDLFEKMVNFISNSDHLNALEITVRGIDQLSNEVKHQVSSLIKTVVSIIGLVG